MADGSDGIGCREQHGRSIATRDDSAANTADTDSGVSAPPRSILRGLRLAAESAGARRLYNFQRPIAAGGEHTANLTESSTTAGQLDAVVIGSSVEFIDATCAEQRAFRCAAEPTN